MQWLGSLAFTIFLFLWTGCYAVMFVLVGLFMPFRARFALARGWARPLLAALRIAEAAERDVPCQRGIGDEAARGDDEHPTENPLDGCLVVGTDHFVEQVRAGERRERPTDEKEEGNGRYRSIRAWLRRSSSCTDGRSTASSSTCSSRS